jgi:hypothetical protein
MIEPFNYKPKTGRMYTLYDQPETRYATFYSIFNQ